MFAALPSHIPLHSDTACLEAPAAALWVGQHALATWALGSLVALGLGALAWAMAHRLRLPHERAPLSGPRLVAAHLGVAAVLWVLAGLLLGTLAQQITQGVGVLVFDHALTATLRDQLPASTLHWFLLPTWLGNPATVVVLTALVTAGLLWRRQRVLAMGWVAAVVGNAVLNRLLKEWFERARPLHEHGVLLETGYSFPSGHASGTLATYGMLAYVVVRLAPRRWHLPAVLAAAWLAWTGAASRVVLQVHYASDVLVGLCNGAAWLALCILSVELVHRRAPGRFPARFSR